MGQRCCRCQEPKNQPQIKKASGQHTTSPLSPVQESHTHPHRSMAGELITCSKARKLDIRDAAIEDYVHL